MTQKLDMITGEPIVLPSDSRGSDTISDVLERPLWQVRLQLAWRSLRGNLALFAESPIGMVGLAIIIIFALMALSWPILINTVWSHTIYDPVIGYDISIVDHPSAPSAAHLLGTDVLGRDILAQLLSSTGSEFFLGMTAALVTVTVATTIGAVSAYYGGILDTVLMRIADIIIMTPFITLLIVLSVLFNVQLIHLGILLGILSGFGGTAVILKSQALSIKVRTYIEAARVAGGGDFHIIFYHIVPNLIPLATLYLMFAVSNAIFAEAVLSFFGLLNIRMSWGIMIYTSQNAGYLLDFERWWLIFPSSVSITLLSAAFFLVGRALDGVVNPKLRRR